MKCFNPPRILNEHWSIYSCLQIPPRENWFQYVRRLYATENNFPCIITLVCYVCIYKVCLFGNAEVSLRDALRRGMKEEELKELIGKDLTLFSQHFKYYQGFLTNWSESKTKFGIFIAFWPLSNICVHHKENQSQSQSARPPGLKLSQPNLT